MSKPIEHYEDPFNGVANEIVSAMSALNMPPDPIPAEHLPKGAFYLSETDDWAKHAMEHLFAAADQNGKAQQKFTAAVALLWKIGWELPPEKASELIELMQRKGIISGVVLDEDI